MNRDGPNQTIPTTVKNSGLSPKRSVAGSSKNESVSETAGNAAAKPSKRLINNVNQDKLKEYLANQQKQESNHNGLPKPPSRNQGENTLTGSHRNLHTVGHLMLKQSSLNARTSTAD